MAKKLGADNYIISTNPDSMKAGFKTLDLILSTISATHEVMPYLNLLKIKGTLVVLGAVATPFKVQFFLYIWEIEAEPRSGQSGLFCHLCGSNLQTNAKSLS